MAEEGRMEAASGIAKSIAINRTAKLEEGISNQKINLVGVSVDNLKKLDAALGEREDWELVEVNLGKGRLYPRGEFDLQEIANSYKYGNDLKQGERGLAPTELLSMFKDNVFGGLRGVFIPGLKKGEFLLLDIEDPLDRRLSVCGFPQDVPQYSVANDYAFPTVKIPVGK